jgi:hypothetical protein
MKNLITLFLVVSVVSLCTISCKDDDDAKPADLLVGTWLEVSFAATGCTDPDDNETNTCTACETLVATATTLKFGTEPPYPYTADGNTLSVTVGAQVFKVTIEVSAETLILTIQDSAADGNCKNVSNYKRQ